jgi:hypothetical protein
MQGPRPIFVALGVLAVLALTGAAGAADGDPYLKSCYATFNVAPCTQLQPPFQAADAELSPDGRHLYAVVWPQGGLGDNGLRLFDVGADGTLSPRAGPAATTTQAPYDVDFSSDGRSVYLAAGTQLLVYSRDPNTGALTQAQCIGAAPCSVVTSSNSFTSAAVSPDGRHVYARGSSQVTVFDRDTSTGTLSQKPGLAGCVTEDTASTQCSTAVGLAGNGFETVISSDGRHVYVSNQAPGGVAVFGRAADGSLEQLPGTQGGCVTAGGTSGAAGGVECSSGSAALSQAWAANVDSRGEFLFISAVGGNTVFRRDATSGTLSQTDCLDEVGGAGPPTGCHEVKGAAGGDAAVTPDGLNVVLNASDFGLSFFRLDRGTGKLAQRSSRGCFSAVVASPCEPVPGLVGGLGGVTVSSNGAYVFTGLRGGSVGSFERDAAPACQVKSVKVPRNATIFVPLSCTDANGDQIRLEIAAPPSNGMLGIVDQKKRRVSYKPEINYRGRDTFAYRGTARGSRGPATRVAITVLKQGRRIDRTPPNTRIRTVAAKTSSSKTALFQFSATERGSRFECKLDKQRWRQCKSPKRYVELRRGRHTFQVRAIDKAGNVDLSPAKRTWIRTR